MANLYDYEADQELCGDEEVWPGDVFYTIDDSGQVWAHLAGHGGRTVNLEATPEDLVHFLGK
ncbi:MAG TPA: hypothetical protein VGL60_08085 [Acidimicrobiales bacterium]|jgi:hypothetical protein